MLPEHSFSFSPELGPELGGHYDPGYMSLSPAPGMWQPSVMKQDAAFLQSPGANTFMMDTMDRSPGHPGGYTLGEIGQQYWGSFKSVYSQIDPSQEPASVALALVTKTAVLVGANNIKLSFNNINNSSSNNRYSLVRAR